MDRVRIEGFGALCLQVMRRTWTSRCDTGFSCVSMKPPTHASKHSGDCTPQRNFKQQKSPQIADGSLEYEATHGSSFSAIAGGET